jgi:hypothetical protein
MALNSNKKYENKPLAEYRMKVRSTKRFLRQFYTPEWLQRPTKTSLIILLSIWAAGIVAALFIRTSNPAEKEGNFLIDLMVIATTCTIMSICFSYIRGIKKDIGVHVPNK